MCWILNLNQHANLLNMNKTLERLSKDILLKLLLKCTHSQQIMFKRMYSHDNIDLSIEEAVYNMKPSSIDNAMNQVERTLNGQNNLDELPLSILHTLFLIEKSFEDYEPIQDKYLSSFGVKVVSETKYVAKHNVVLRQISTNKYYQTSYEDIYMMGYDYVNFEDKYTFKTKLTEINIDDIIFDNISYSNLCSLFMLNEEVVFNFRVVSNTVTDVYESGIIHTFILEHILTNKFYKGEYDLRNIDTNSGGDFDDTKKNDYGRFNFDTRLTQVFPENSISYK